MNVLLVWHNSSKYSFKPNRVRTKAGLISWADVGRGSIVHRHSYDHHTHISLLILESMNGPWFWLVYVTEVTDSSAKSPLKLTYSCLNVCSFWLLCRNRFSLLETIFVYVAFIYFKIHLLYTIFTIYLSFIYHNI